MADAQLPSLSGFMSDPKYAAQVPAAIVNAPPPPPAPSGLGALAAGFRAGLSSTGAALTGAASGAAKLAGADDTSASLGQTAQGLSDDAARVSGGLDTQSYTGHGWGAFANKALYTAGSLVPQIGGAIAGTALAGAALPEEAAAGGGLLLGRLGASLPKFLGGAGLGAGFAEGAAPEVLGAGLNTAKNVIGAGGVMGLQSSGDIVNEEAKQEGGLTRGGAAKAFAMGLPIGLVQGLAPADAAAGASSIFGSTAARGVAESATMRGLKDAAANAVGSGLQAAAETSVDPNMSTADRVKAITTAAASGAEVGGLLGVGFGMLHNHGTAGADLDAEMKANGVDPDNPAGTSAPGPTPPPAPAPAPVQGELPLGQPLPAAAPSDQLSLLPQPDAQGPLQPFRSPPVPTRDDAALLKALNDARAAATKPAAAAAATPAETPVTAASLLKEATSAPPPNQAIRSLMDKGGLKMGRGNTPFTEFVRNSTATNDAELHNEMLAVPPDSPVAQDKRFTQMADVLGVGDPTLDEQLQKLGADKSTAEAKALFFKLAVRDAAASLRPTEAARAEPAAPEPQAPAVTPQGAPSAAPDAAGTPPAVATAAPARADLPPVAVPFEGELPGLAPVADATVPSVRGPAEAHTAETAPAPTAALQAELDTLDGSTPQTDAGSAPTLAAADATSRGPQSIADRVKEVARATVGDAGGQVSIADLRKALPDVHAADFDRALQDLHADDSDPDTTLAQAPKGQRAGVDGVTVQGVGKHHFLDLGPQEPTDAAVQERGAAPEAAADPAAGAVPTDGGGDAQGEAPAGAGGAEDAPEGQPGTPDVPQAEGVDAATGLPLVNRTTGEPYDLTKPRDRRLAKMQADSDAARASREAAYAAEAQARDAFNEKVDASPRDQVPLFPGDEDTAHPILKAKNDVARALNALPDAEYKAIQKDYQGDGAHLGRLIGNTTEPEKLHGLMMGAVDRMRQAETAPALAATEAKIAPVADPTPAKAPEQLGLDLEKTAATSRILTAPDDAAKPVQKKLRQRSKAQTALIETPNGDQVPTEAVGSSLTDLPQAAASVPDPAPEVSKDLFGNELPKLPRDVMPGVDQTRLPREDAEAHIQRFVDKLAPEVRDRIKVVGKDDAIPGRAQPMGDTHLGLYRDGKVYINADRMRSRADIEDTLSHEVFGHLGNSADLGGLAGAHDEQRYQARMLGILNRAGGVEGIKALAKEAGVWEPKNGGAGLKAYFPDGRNPTRAEAARIVDELIAHAAERDPPKMQAVMATVQTKIRRAIVNTLRAAGLHDFARRMDRFTQAELQDWVGQTRKALTSQPKAGDVDMLARATTPRHFVDGVAPSGEPPFMARLAAQQKDTEGAMGYVYSAMNALESKVPYQKLFGQRLEERGVKAPKIAEVARNHRDTILANLATSHGIAEEGRRIGLGRLADIREADKGRQDAMTMLNEPANRVAQDHLNLRVADRARAKLLDRFMANVTSRNLDPFKTFEEHTWLTAGKEPEEVEAQRARYNEMKKDWDKLGTPIKGGKSSPAQDIVRKQLALSNMVLYMREASRMHDTLDTTFGHGSGGYEPIKRYSGQDGYIDPATKLPLNEGLRGDVYKGREFFKGEFDRTLAAGRKLLLAHDQANDARLEAAAQEAGTKRREGDVRAARSADHAALAERIKAMEATEQNLVQQGPYFRMGRSGDYAVGFSVRNGKDANNVDTGTFDQGHFDALQEAINKDFPQLTFGASQENGKFFARFPSQEMANNFYKRIAQGGDLRQHIEPSKGTYVSMLSHAAEHDRAVPFLEKQVAEAGKKFDAELAAMHPEDPARAGLLEARNRYIANLRATVLDLSGDNSMRSILSTRQDVQGANSDMLENQKAMAASYARAAATTAFRSEIADALAQSRASIKAMGKSGRADALDRSARMQRVLDAFEERRKAADVRLGTNVVDHIRSMMHSYQLGGSFGYAMLNFGQLGNLTLPELIRHHSAVRAVPAMIRALGPAAKILRAMWTTRMVNSDGTAGERNLFEGGITTKVMDKANLSAADRLSLSTLVNHGHLELGGFTAAESGLGVGNLGLVGRYRHYVNSTAVMAETLSRLVTAFASMHLHDTMPEGPKRDAFRRQYPTREGYAGHVINETMMGWGSYETPKIMTAGGFGGGLGQLAGQFHGWVPRLAEKLYRESRDAYGSRLAETMPKEQAAAAKAEAQRFMFAHMATTMAMSGALGLPLAGYLASAATTMSGYLLGQPYDFEAHMRNGLAGIFGKDVGEMISRGVPRYLGVDMSENGDNDLGPFSKLVEDRRKWEDAVPDYLAHAWGAFPGAVLNAGIAARDMAEGRWAEAGARSLPTVARNFARAYRVSNLGYVNTIGERLPISSGAAEVLKTAMGLTGGEYAEEKERQESLEGLRDDRQKRTNLLKRNIVTAYTNKDPAAVQSALAEAAQYDRDNPGAGMTQRIAGYLQLRQKAEALGQHFGTLGVDPRDRVAQGLIQH